MLANSLDTTAAAKLEVRDADSGTRIVRTLPYPRGAHVHLSADGPLVVLGCGADGTVLLHASDWSPGARLPITVQGRALQCAISFDGRTVAFGANTSVCLVNTQDGRMLAHLVGAQAGGYMPGLAYSPDGRQLAVLWDDGQLSIWDLEKLQGELRPRHLSW